MEARLDAIRGLSDEVSARLAGLLLSKCNHVRLKDGRVHVSPEHFAIQCRGADGKRTWKRISRNAQTAVRRRVRVGGRCRAVGSGSPRRWRPSSHWRPVGKNPSEPAAVPAVLDRKPVWACNQQAFSGGHASKFNNAGDRPGRGKTARRQ